MKKGRMSTMQRTGKYVAELRSRYTGNFDSQAEALSEAICKWAWDWGSTNPECTHQLGLYAQVDFGQDTTGIQYLAGFLVKMHKPSRYSAVEIVSIVDGKGAVIATNPRPEDLCAKFGAYFAGGAK